jgi:hypothetical protein
VKAMQREIGKPRSARVDAPRDVEGGYALRILSFSAARKLVMAEGIPILLPNEASQVFEDGPSRA